MTHRNNYEYVKRWRANHYELHKKRNVEYTMKWYYWKKYPKNLGRNSTPNFFYKNL